MDRAGTGPMLQLLRATTEARVTQSMIFCLHCIYLGYIISTFDRVFSSFICQNLKVIMSGQVSVFIKYNFIQVYALLDANPFIGTVQRLSIYIHL